MRPDPRYEVIIYWSLEDRAFVAEVPELPGCASDGPTYEAALANVKVIIQQGGVRPGVPWLPADLGLQSPSVRL